MVEYSLTELTLRLGALLLPPIPEGVIEVKPRGGLFAFFWRVGLSYYSTASAHFNLVDWFNNMGLK